MYTQVYMSTENKTLNELNKLNKLNKNKIKF